MVSEMAIEDIEALRADGVEVSPRDVVRLNALGLRVERSARASSDFAMPRVAFLGRIPFREPTIAAELWFVETEHVFDHGDEGTALLLRALSMSTPFEGLPDPCDADAVGAAMAEVRNRLAAYTVAQLKAAVMYALVGGDHAKGEAGGRAKGGGEAGEGAGVPYEVGVLRDGVALRLGSAEDLRKFRTSELQALVLYASELKFGASAAKSRHADLLGEYLAALEEVKASNLAGKVEG